MRGVAGDAQRRAAASSTQALQRAGIANAPVDFGDVAPITQAGCAALDTYRQVRATGDYPSLGAAAAVRDDPPAARRRLCRPGGVATRSINFNFGNLQGDFALIGIEPNGMIAYTVPDREDFDARLAQSRNGRPITDRGRRPLPALHRRSIMTAGRASS